MVASTDCARRLALLSMSQVLDLLLQPFAIFCIVSAVLSYGSHMWQTCCWRRINLELGRRASLGSGGAQGPPVRRPPGQNFKMKLWLSFALLMVLADQLEAGRYEKISSECENSPKLHPPEPIWKRSDQNHGFITKSLPVNISSLITYLEVWQEQQ